MLLRALGAIAAVLLISCRGSDSAPTRTSQPPDDRPAGTATPGRIAAPDTGADWVRAAKDYSSSRFSALTDITTANASQLGVRLTFSTGVVAPHAAATIVEWHPFSGTAAQL